VNRRRRPVSYAAQPPSGAIGRRPAITEPDRAGARHDDVPDGVLARLIDRDRTARALEGQTQQPSESSLDPRLTRLLPLRLLGSARGVGRFIAIS
jgi:hypothetical protein